MTYAVQLSKGTYNYLQANNDPAQWVGDECIYPSYVIIYCKGMQDELAQNDITMMSAAMTISLIIHKVSLHLAAKPNILHMVRMFHDINGYIIIPVAFASWYFDLMDTIFHWSLTT